MAEDALKLKVAPVHDQKEITPPSLSIPLFTKFILPLCLVLICAIPGRAAQFTSINPSLPAPPRPSVTWADYDGDGDLDLLIAGEGSQHSNITSLYRNDAGVFTDSGIFLNPLSIASAAWGDFDNDGDLDLAMIGENTSSSMSTFVYRNDGASFTPLPGSFIGVAAGSLAWGDYDNDGDLDLLVTGIAGTSPNAAAITRLYRNDGNGAFVSAPHPFPAIYLGAVAWGDYDNDGDLDVIITGSGAQGGGVQAAIWRNNGHGEFTDAGANLPGADIGFARWGDFDGDGDLDLLFGGDSTAGRVTRIYRNDTGKFVDTEANLMGVLWSSADWGDFDNDGDLDFIIIGYDAVSSATKSILYRNDQGTFVPTTDTFIPAFLGALGWADYDNDGDLDLLIAGNGSNNLGDKLRIYRNNSTIANTAPAAPANLTAEVQGTSVNLSWDAATDAQTSGSALTYNLRVGTTPGGSEIVAPQALSSGLGLLPAMGNTQLALSHPLRGLAHGITYYWTVQSVDTGLKASAFAAEGSFTATADTTTPPQLESVVSRMIHGSAGSFDISLPGVESRAGGVTGDYQLVATFASPVTVGGNPQAQVTAGIGEIGSGGTANGGLVSATGNTVVIPLTNVANAQTISVTVFGVTDGTNIGDVVIPMKILIGDTNSSSSVSSTDVSQTKSQSGQPVTSANFQLDVNASGTINATDISLVKSHSGSVLP
ncbi:MAG TPA: VCBS repeat-containing protein [Chthoniobacterales bacterium]|nr:VCBS repeat-containing protein [Chthoniobacterales bacterium]